MTSYDTAQHSTAQHSTAQHSTAGTVRHKAAPDSSKKSNLLSAVSYMMASGIGETLKQSAKSAASVRPSSGGLAAGA